MRSVTGDCGVTICTPGASRHKAHRRGEMPGHIPDLVRIRGKRALSGRRTTASPPVPAPLPIIAATAQCERGGEGIGLRTPGGIDHQQTAFTAQVLYRLARCNGGNTGPDGRRNPQRIGEII